MVTPHFRNTTVTPSLAVPAVTGAYGGVATLTATLTSGGAGVNGKVVSFTLNGAPVGTATTDTVGLATLSEREPVRDQRGCLSCRCKQRCQPRALLATRVSLPRAVLIP